MVALLVLVRLLGYSPGTESVILLLSLGVLPFSLSVLNKAVFRAWERMHYIAWANVPVNVAKVGLGFLLLWQGHGLLPLVLLLLACYVAILGIEWWLMLRHITRPRLRINRRFCTAMLRSTSPFLGITALVAINARLDLILLSRFSGEAQVGLYNSAVQWTIPLTVVFEAIMLSVFPEMSRRFTAGRAHSRPSERSADESKDFVGTQEDSSVVLRPTVALDRAKSISEHVLELLLAIALPAAVGLSFLAEPALLLLYGNADFAEAAPALSVLAWTLVMAACTHVLGRALMASRRETVTLRIVVLGTLLRLFLGLTLIGFYGLIGAAVAALLTALVSFLLHYASVSKLLFNLPLPRLAWKPAAASACMAFYLLLVGSQGFLLTAVSAGGVYTLCLLALVIWSNGGLRKVTAKYRYLWSS
jgi:O-antigen/teichoic acid export membrane protein